VFKTRLSESTNHRKFIGQAAEELARSPLYIVLKRSSRLKELPLCPPLSTSVSIIVKKKVTILKNRQGNGPVRGSLTSFRNRKSQVVEPRPFRVFLFSPSLRRNDTTSKTLYVDHLLESTNRPVSELGFSTSRKSPFIVAAAAPRFFRVFPFKTGLQICDNF